MVMPYVWADGFDSTDASHFDDWYQLGTPPQSIASPGRFGIASCVRLTGGLRKTVAGGPYVYMAVGGAVKFDTSINGMPSLIGFDNTLGFTHIDLARDSSGFLVLRPHSGATFTYSAVAMLPNTWYHVALAAKWSASGTGQMRAWLDGNLVLSADNVDTDNEVTALDEFQGFYIGGQSTGIFWDDVWVTAADSISASLDDEFRGDKVVRDHLPQSDGDHQQWTQSTGGTKFGVVDEIGPNDDTDYLSDATPGNRCCFGVGNLAADLTSIDAVMLLATGRFDTTGPHSIKNYVRQVGTANFDQAEHALSVTHSGHHDVLPTDPVTGTGWTKTGFEARQYGIKDES